MADLTPQPAPQPARGPSVSGEANADAELKKLAASLRAETEEIRQNGQTRANLIDRYKQETQTLGLLELKIAEGKAALEGLMKVHKSRTAQSASEKRDLRLQITSRKAELESLRMAAAAHEAYRAKLAAGTDAIAKRRDAEEAKAKGDRKHLATAREARDAYAPRKAVEATSKIAKAPELKGAVADSFSNLLKKITAKDFIPGGFTNAVGNSYAALQILADMLGRATKNTSDYVNAFGAQGGLYVDTGLALKYAMMSQGAFNTMLIRSADLSSFTSKVMGGGALGLYQAQVMAGGSATDMAKVMGTMAPQMLLVGKALGMNADQAAELFLSLNNTMGAFAGTALSAKTYSDRLNEVFQKFNFMQQKTGLDMKRLIGITSEFSAVTLPLGTGLEAIQAQVGNTVGTLKDMVTAMGKTDAATKAYLGNAANMEAFAKTLFGIGKGISAEHAVGYQMVRGTAGGGDPIKQIMDSMMRTPFQRLADQIGAFQTVSGKNTDMLGVMLSKQAGYSDQIVVPLRKLMNQPEQFDKLVQQMGSATFSEADAKKIAASSGVSELTKIAAKLTLSDDPINQVIKILENIADLISSGLFSLPSLFGKGPAAGMAGISTRIKPVGGSGPNILSGRG